MRHIIIYVTLAAAASLAGCGASSRQRDMESNRRLADSVYVEQVKLLRAYTDSLAAAADSARVHSLAAAFDDRQAALAVRASALGDTLLDDHRQETLWRLTEKYVKTLRIATARLLLVPADSLAAPADSIPTP